MKHTMYLLAADRARAKIYQIEPPSMCLTVVYDQVNFVARMNPAAVAANEGRYQPDLIGLEPACSADDEDFAKNLCQLLRSKYKIEKFTGLVVIAPEAFLAAILRQLDRDCLAVLQGSIAMHPAQLNECEIVQHLQGFAIAAI